MRTLPIKSLLAVAAALLLMLFAPAAKAGDVVDQLKQMTAEGYGRDSAPNPGHVSDRNHVTPGPDRRYEGDGNRGRQSNRVWVDPYRKCYYLEGSPRFGQTRGEGT